MGNNLIIDNQIPETNVVTIKLAGSKNILVKETFTEQLKTNYHFSPSIFESKTFIINVNDKVSRAIGNNKSIRITQSENGQLKIFPIPKQYQMESSLEQILENVDSNLNWNVIADENVKNEYTKAANDVINMMNKFVAILGFGVSNVVKIIPNNAAIAQFGSKFASDMITNFMKTAIIKSQSDKSTYPMEPFQKTYHQLIAVSRAIEIDYLYLTEERKIDNEKAFEFLHNQMMKITNSDMLPFLEDCNKEEAVVIYIFAIGLVMDICHKMNQLSDIYCPNKLEQRYMLIFSKNLYEIWQNILIQMTKDIRVKTTGWLIKTAHLTYRNNHVYKMKSFCKDRLNDRILDIKEAFISNMRYQMDFLYGHPETVINKCKEVSTIMETSLS